MLNQLTGGRRFRPIAGRALPGELTMVTVGLAVIAAALAGMSLLFDVIGYDVVLAVIVFMVLLVITFPFAWATDRREGDPWLFKAILIAFLVKMAFSLIRYYVIFVVYRGNADAGVYHEAALELYEPFRSGDFTVPQEVLSLAQETRNVAAITGVIYAIFGPSIYSGFFVFSWFAFAGCLAFFRAFRVAFPEGDHRRYFLLVFFLPSMLFWPASIGKDAVMVLGLGLMSLGAAHIIGPRPRLHGILWGLLGAWPIMIIRGHIALIVLLALGAAVGIRAAVAQVSSFGHRKRGLAVGAIAIVLVVVGAVMATRSVEARFGEEGGGATGILDAAQQATQQGGSAFTPTPVTTPLHIPLATVSVLLRPFPWEARNLNLAISASETLLLGVLIVFSWRRIARWPSNAVRRPYLTYCAVYTLLFIVAFSTIGNMGILARQRVQVLPALIAILAMPAAAWWREQQQEAPPRRRGPLGSRQPAATSGSEELDVAEREVPAGQLGR